MNQDERKLCIDTITTALENAERLKIAANPRYSDGLKAVAEFVAAFPACIKVDRGSYGMPEVYIDMSYVIGAYTPHATDMANAITEAAVKLYVP